MTVTLYPGPMAHLLRSPTGPVGTDLVRRGHNVASTARRLCPVGKGTGPGGHLRDTIGSQPPVVLSLGLSVTVAALSDHAIYVHEGTRPHPIDPVRGRVLRFEASGGLVFARHVDHHGTSGQPFLRNALPAAAH